MFRNKMPLCCRLQFKKLAAWHTFGTAAWKRMLVTGVGAEESIEMITTSTSGRDGGQSRAKVNKTRRLCLSNTVTGNKLPEMELKIHTKTNTECGMWKREKNKKHSTLAKGIASCAYWVWLSQEAGRGQPEKYCRRGRWLWHWDWKSGGCQEALTGWPGWAWSLQRGRDWRMWWRHLERV